MPDYGKPIITSGEPCLLRFIPLQYLLSICRPRSVYRPLNPLVPSRGEFPFCFTLIMNSTDLNCFACLKDNNGTVLLYKDGMITIALFKSFCFFLLFF